MIIPHPGRPPSTADGPYIRFTNIAELFKSVMPFLFGWPARLKLL
jgi:hypothetical protein